MAEKPQDPKTPRNKCGFCENKLHLLVIALVYLHQPQIENDDKICPGCHDPLTLEVVRNRLEGKDPKLLAERMLNDLGSRIEHLLGPGDIVDGKCHFCDPTETSFARKMATALLYISVGTCEFCEVDYRLGPDETEKRLYWDTFTLMRQKYEENCLGQDKRL